VEGVTPTDMLKKTRSEIKEKDRHTRQTHTQPSYGPFSGTTRMSWCQKKSYGLYGAREDNRGRHTDKHARKMLLTVGNRASYLKMSSNSHKDRM